MRYVIILLALLGASCSSTLPSVKPYHLDIQQGNVVSAKMMMQLKPGMTKSQVRYVLGTPLLQDAFHQNRWDYVYHMAKGGKVIERRRIILDFENDGLKAVRGDIIPAGAPGAEEAPIASVTDLKTVKSDKTLLAEDPKTSWYDRFKFWGDDKPQADKPAESPEPRASVAKQASEKSWYDSLKFWGDDEKPAPQAAKSAEVAPVKKAAEPAPEKPAEPVVAEKAPEVVEPPAESASASEEKMVVREVADQVTGQSEQMVQEEKSAPSTDYQSAVAKAVDNWAKAWRNKNVDVYLKAYADKFQPDGIAKKAWLAQRKQRVGAKSGAISLSLGKLSIQADAKKASASFVQRYASGDYSDVVNKVLNFENINGNWLIVRESVVTELAKPVEAEVGGEMYAKPRDVTADEKSEAMPEKLLQESAKQAQQVKPMETKPAEVKPVEAKSAEPKPVEVPAQVKQPAAKAESQKAPVNKKDAPLPPEDAPDFFERMLEKIGF
jgi:outer membrane protein assembly factor BamE (lipoprotein component of BamABCDE complex)